MIAYCRIGERSAHTWFVLTQLLGLSERAQLRRFVDGVGQPGGRAYRQRRKSVVSRARRVVRPQSSWQRKHREGTENTEGRRSGCDGEPCADWPCATAMCDVVDEYRPVRTPARQADRMSVAPRCAPVLPSVFSVPSLCISASGWRGMWYTRRSHADRGAAHSWGCRVSTGRRRGRLQAEVPVSKSR